jgi:AAA+ superfamily predicted ATPase
MPDYAQRLRLWEDNFADKPYRLPANVNLAALARDHEISGGNIVNVLRYACLKAIARGSESLRLEDILQAVRNERHKEGRFQA